MADKAFIKGLNVLKALAYSDTPRGVTSLANELQMTKSNVHRLLQALMDQRFVAQDETSSGYFLTTHMWELGSNVVSRLDFVQVARERMPALAEKVGETIHLSALEGTEVIYLDKIESHHAVRSYTRVGSRAPAWCVATGKAMIAFQPEDLIASIEPSFRTFTPHSIVSLASLQAEIEEIRRSGIAINRGEWREDVVGAASPIRDAGGRVVAAIGISGPAARLKSRRLKELSHEVLAASRDISRSLGYMETSGGHRR